MITPAQCRAARALLEISQRQLAEESGVGLRALQGFEAGERTLQSLAMSAIERLFKDRGVVIIMDSRWSGVKIDKSYKPIQIAHQRT